MISISMAYGLTRHFLFSSPFHLWSSPWSPPLSPITRIFLFFKLWDLVLLHWSVFLYSFKLIFCDLLFLLWDTGGWSRWEMQCVIYEPLWSPLAEVMGTVELALFLSFSFFLTSSTNAQGCPLSNDVLSAGCGFAWQDSGASLFRCFEKLSSMFAIAGA